VLSPELKEKKEMSAELKDAIDFGSMDIPKLFRKLLIPTLMGMVFSAAFVITDGIFVGKGIGSDGLAAVKKDGAWYLIDESGVDVLSGENTQA